MKDLSGLKRTQHPLNKKIQSLKVIINGKTSKN